MADEERSKGAVDSDVADSAVIERRAAASWARGATRRVRVTYGCSCETLAGAEAVSVLNVAMDPDLVEELLSGSLNRATCPACGADQLLRLAVTVHDPAARRVVICAGEGDRHRALDLLIRYLEGLRDQPGDSVPGYALAPEIAFGRSAWRQHLQAPPRDSTRAVLAELEARKAELEEQAGRVERRQGALAANQRDIETARQAIESQMKILGDRTAGLDARESALAELERLSGKTASRCDELEQVLDDEKTRSRRLQEEIDALRSTVEDRDAALRRREDDLAAAEERVTTLEAELGRAAAAPAVPAPEPEPESGAAAVEPEPEEEIVTAEAEPEPEPEGAEPSAAEPPARAPLPPPPPAARRPTPPQTPPARDAERGSGRWRIATPLEEAVAAAVQEGPGGARVTTAVPAEASEDRAPRIAEPVPELAPLFEPDEEEEPPVRVGDHDVVDERALEPETDVSEARRARRAIGGPPPRRAAEPVAAPEAPVVEVAPEDLGEPETESAPAAEPVPPPAPPARPAKAAEDSVPEHLRAWLASGVPTHAAVEEGRVRLYRRHLPDTSAAQRLDLAVGCRLFVHDEVPWLQLALIDPGSTPPELVDTWLSHFELVDEAPVSRVLGERFEVQIVEVDERGRSQWQADLAAPLARNVVRIRQAAARLGAKKKGDRAAAIDAVRVEGADWLDRTGMPAFDAPEAPGSPAQVQRALVELTPWSTDDAEERLFVGRSVPVELVEGYRRRLLPPAIAAGLWLPPDLARRAVSDGLVPSAERLVAQLFDNFWTLTGHRHDVDRETMARNWLSLSHDAAEHGLAIEPRRQAFVQALLEEEGLSDTGAGPRLGPESAEGQPDLLLRWIGVDSGRAAAVGILLKMRAADFVLDLAAALDGLRAADLAESLIDLRTNEDLVAELFMAGLGAQRPPLRLASATGLGKLALRRAIVPLVHLLLRAGDEEWRFVGAAIAAYGATGAKAMEPMLADPRGREDRLAWTLASFHGAAAEKHVAAMTDSAELLTAAIARRAADWRNDVEQFRARLAESDGRTDAFGFVRLVRRILGEDPAEQLRAAIHDLRARGGVDI